MEENIAVVADDAAVADDLTAADETAAEEVVPPKKKRHINRAKLQDNIWGWVFCIPLIVGTVWFVYAALIMALLLSFTNFQIGGANSATLMQYLGNYASNIFERTDIVRDAAGAIVSVNKVRDPFYWYRGIFTNTGVLGSASQYSMNQMGAYLFNTVFYMIGIPIGMILSMFIAVCMSRDIKGASLFRVLYYIPCVASSIAIVYTFKILFNEHGVMNSLFGAETAVNGQPLNWLGGTYTWNQLTNQEVQTAFMDTSFWCSGFINKCVIVIMSVWKGLGGTIILYVAGLSGVNAATKEAAQIDGASGWKIFWKVTMPDLYPTIFYNIVTSVIGGMQIYAEPVLFFGEAGDATLTQQISNTSGYVSLVWKYGLSAPTEGGATTPSAGAAYGMFLAIIIFFMTLFQFWLDSRKKD